MALNPKPQRSARKTKKQAQGRAGSATRLPVAERPHMPDYGISTEPEGLLQWSWAEERLTQSRIYWLTTITPRGEPHVMPIWGIWMKNRFYFSTGGKSAKARNLAVNPKCVIANDNADQALILHGSAARLENDDPRISGLSEIYKAKYDFPLNPELGPVYEITPSLVFAQPHDQYVQSATRWRF